MKQGNMQYQKLKKILKYLLAADLLAFLTLMTASAVHVPEVKFFSAISTLLLSGLCLTLLYRSHELMRRRSFWMTVSSGALAACAVFSLVLHFPSPNPLDQPNPYTTTEETLNPEFTIAGWITEGTSASTADTKEQLIPNDPYRDDFTHGSEPSIEE